MNNQKNMTMIQNLTVEFRAKILKRHLVLPFYADLFDFLIFLWKAKFS